MNYDVPPPPPEEIVWWNSPSSTSTTQCMRSHRHHRRRYSSCRRPSQSLSCCRPRHRPPRSSFCPPQCSWRCRPMCTRQPMWRRHPTNYFREHPQYHRHQQRDQQHCGEQRGTRPRAQPSKRCSWGRHAGGCRKPFDRPNPAAVGRAESRADSAPGFEGAVQTNDWSNITDSHAGSAGQPAPALATSNQGFHPTSFNLFPRQPRHPARRLPPAYPSGRCPNHGRARYRSAVGAARCSGGRTAGDAGRRVT